jgi:hypothetical protein
MTNRIELPDIGHRNLVGFEATAMFADVPTDRPAHVTDADAKQVVEGQKYLFPRAAIEKALPSLLGMPVCAQEVTLNVHAPRSVVGAVTEAWLEGTELKIRGHIWSLLFPDCIEAITKMRTRLGACPSYRDLIIEVPTEEKPEVIVVRELCFTGLALMKKVLCGFERTSVRLLPALHRWPCAEAGCPKFIVGAVRVFCPDHQA